MNSRLSYVDRLNDGRQRKPSSALDSISQALGRLERQLGQTFDVRDDDIGRRIKRLADEVSSRSDSPVRLATDPLRGERLTAFDRQQRTAEGYPLRNDQPASVDTLAAELRNLRNDLQTAINRELREEFAELRNQIGTLLDSVPASREAEGLEAGLSRIAHAVAELGERDDRDTQLLQLELGRVKAAIEDLLQLEQSRADSSLSGSLDLLQERLDQIAANIERLPDLHIIQVFDEHMRQLTMALEKLASRAQADQQQLVEAIDERLDEISRAIAASAAAASSSGINAASIERIEARIGSLARQIEELNEDSQPATVLEHLADLSARVDDIARRIEIPEQSLDRLARCVTLISERIGSTAMPPETEQMLLAIQAQLSQLSTAFARHQADLLHQGAGIFHELEQKLAHVVERLETVAPRAADQDLMTMLDERLADLARRMDDVRAAEDERALNALDARLEAMANQLYSITGNSADPRLLRKLENQLSHLSTLLAQPGQDSLAQLAPRLEQIERSLTENRETLVEAARQAAEDVLQKFAASKEPKQMDARLQEELQRLESLTRHNAERNSRTFEAIHDTLLKIVGRLGALEAEGRTVVVAAAPEGATPAVAAPEELPVEPVPAEPESTVKSRLRALSDALRRRSSKQDTATAEPAPAPAAVREEEDPAPDINAILRRVRGAETRAEGRDDLIASARKSLLSSGEAMDTDPSEDAGETKSRLSISSILRRHRKHAAAAISGVVLIAGGLQVASVLSRSPAVPDAATVAEAPAGQTLASAVEEAVDPIQTATVAAETDAEGKRDIERLIPQHAFAAPEVAAPRTNADTTASFVPSESDLPPNLGIVPLREAALQGNALAYFEIANRLAEGRGVPADMAAAAVWYERAAEKGLALAQYRIANMYEKGNGVDRDLARARKWYEAAARQGNVTAMHNLGVLLAMGADGAPDHKAAVRWFTEAADLNVTDSQFNLAILAAKGLGMEKDLTESYKWLDIVARKGDADAAAKRDELAEVMDPEELKVAEGKAKLWKARTPDAEANTASIPLEWTDTQISSNSPEYRRAVANIQAILNKIGYDAGAADGVIGSKTRSAIRAFQSQNGLNPTGEIDDALVRKLLELNETA